MGKAITPSGYYIINLNLEGKTSGVGFTPETDDEKILFDILNGYKINKPILLNLVTDATDIMGFAILEIGSQSLTIIGSSYSERLYITGTKLAFYEVEL